MRIPDGSNAWNYLERLELLERVLIFLRERQFPAVAVGIEDVDRVVVGAAVRPDFFHMAPDCLAAS